MMRAIDAVQLGLFVLVLAVTAGPLAAYLQRVFDGGRTRLSPLLVPVERAIFRLADIDPDREQSWSRYALSALVLSAVTFFLVYFLLRLQGRLPLNPQGLPAVAPHVAFNAAMAYLTNTSWQSFSGEATMSYFSQTVPLTLAYFVSPAIGLAIAVATVRGVSRRESPGIGNFWTDIVRGVVHVLLPLGFIVAVVLVSQGVVQNFLPYREVTTLESARQIIAQGPAASQAALKVLGTNGGGFFNANGAHPYEGPNGLVNFVTMLAIFLIPSALVVYLGRATRHPRHGWALWIAVCALFVAGAVVCAHFEAAGLPLLAKAGAASPANFEGKETRFGVFSSALFAAVTSASSCGAVNAMLDSFTPLGGLVPLVNMLAGEVIFGGVGVGLTGILVVVLLTTFLGGLMIGRTPEYLGKKIGPVEIKLAVLTIVVSALPVLAFTAWALVDERGLAGLGNPGPHGFTETLYAYTSATMNNGSAFAGLNANSPFWNVTLGLAMFAGRYGTLVPVLALAGSLARKKIHPRSAATLPADGILFSVLFVSVIVLVGALGFFPALALGPILEHLNAGG